MIMNNFYGNHFKIQIITFIYCPANKKTASAVLATQKV